MKTVALVLSGRSEGETGKECNSRRLLRPLEDVRRESASECSDHRLHSSIVIGCKVVVEKFGKKLHGSLNWAGNR